MIANGLAGVMQSPKAQEDHAKEFAVTADKTGIPRHIVIDRERAAKRKAEYLALTAKMRAQP